MVSPNVNCLPSVPIVIKFSSEEFPYYNSRADFDWDRIVDLIYSERGTRLAKELLEKRRSV